MTDKKPDGGPAFKTFTYQCMANDRNPSSECIQVLAQVMDLSYGDLRANDYYAIAAWFSRTYAP